MHYSLKDFLLTVLLRSVSYKDLLLQIKWGQSKQYFQIFVSYSSKIASNQEGFFFSQNEIRKLCDNEKDEQNSNYELSLQITCSRLDSRIISIIEG